MAALALGLIAPDLALAQQTIPIPSETPPALMAYLHRQAPATTVTGYLYLPAGAAGPVPAMILKHDSSGLTGASGDNIRAWAKQLNAWGVAAFIVDSFGPRGVTSTTADQTVLPQWADLADSFNALKLLAADPRIDKSRIGIMGWSRGGMIAMIAALETARRAVLSADGPRFAAHIVFYGSAATQYRDSATDGAPLLFFHGEADDYVALASVKESAAWIQGKGDAVTFITYPGATHAFDVQGGVSGLVRSVQSGRNCDAVIDLPTVQVTRLDHKPATGITVQAFSAYFRSCTVMGAHLAYDAAARADTVQKTHAFLQQVFHIGG
jgi:dienelactone hydrolase